jgi:hypothetical protein
MHTPASPRPTPAALETQRAAVAELCRAYGVQCLELFGSAARGAGEHARDFDFIVRFAPPHGPGYADRYLGLAEALEKLLGKRVDLLTDRSLRNPILRDTIASDRCTIYAA